MRKSERRKVVWTIKAASALNEHVHYLRERSPQAAVCVRKEIIRTTRSLEDDPEIFQLDEYRSNRNENVRRFFRWHYKIVYQVFDTEIVILDIIHTSKKPLV